MSNILFFPPLKIGDMIRRLPDSTHILKILDTKLITPEKGIKKLILVTDVPINLNQKTLFGKLF